MDITGWNQNEVQIDAVKTASDQQKLDNMKIEVNAGASSVEIKTKLPEHMVNNNPGSVHYTLHVPANARIDKIDLVNGSLTVKNITGEINANLVNGKVQASDLTGTADMATVNGTIDATYNSLKNVREIKLKSVNGTVNLTLPAIAERGRGCQRRKRQHQHRFPADRQWALRRQKHIGQVRQRRCAH